MAAGQEALIGRYEIIPGDDARVSVPLVVAFDKLSGLLGINTARFFVSHLAVFLSPHDRMLTIEAMFDHAIAMRNVPPLQQDRVKVWRGEYLKEVAALRTTDEATKKVS